MKEENVFSHLDTCNGENKISDALGVKAAETRSITLDADLRNAKLTLV